MFYEGMDINMNIGLISINNKPTSKLSEGGTEVFTSLLAEELIRRGNNVYIFGSENSYVDKAHNICTSISRNEIESYLENKYGVSLNNNELQNIYYMLCLRNISFAKKYEKEIDVFHDNTSSPIIQSVLDVLKKPVISSLHMPVDNLRKYEEIFRYLIHNNVFYVATSKYQQNLLNFKTQLIYNGIPLDDYNAFHYQKKEQYSWIGRIDSIADKGLKDASIACKKTKNILHYRAFIEDDNFYENDIKPELDNNCISVNSFNSLKEKIKFYSEAKALINPIKWEEPFGLTMIEAMAVGTPVIAYARGAAPEIIIDGKTGFLINSSINEKRGNWMIQKTGINGLIEAIEIIGSMTDNQYSDMCQNCRAVVRNKFSIEKMVDQYELLYQKVLNTK